MDEYQQLKTEFEELSAFVSEYLGSDCEEQLRLYILSAWTKIWAANGLYAPVYAKALPMTS